MALPHLTDEETRTWTREQKDRWWLENVFRGEMPQLTIRAAITGFLLGGILSATNLYIGAKTGWALGVGVTSVILSFVIFRAISKMRIAGDMTILENNAVQSIATAAGYMTGPLISALMAYMFVTNTTMEWYKMLVWNIVASLLGVMVAFPMKRRFINDEQQPFPEGRACAVVLDSLYPDAPQGGTKNMDGMMPVARPKPEAGSGIDAGVFKAKALAVAAAIGAGLQLVYATGYMALLQIVAIPTAKATDKLLKIPEHLDAWYYKLAEKNSIWMPGVKGIPLPQLGINIAFDLSMIGAGGLMGMRIANSVMLGMVVNFLFVAPIMIGAGEIIPKNLGAISNPDGTYLFGDAIFGRPHLTNSWCLWWGVAMMVTASMVGLFAKPKMLLSAFTGLFARKAKTDDCLRDIEFPIRWSVIGIPIASAAIIYINHEWFGVSWWIGALSIPLIIVLTLIAANATALTSTTPTGSLSKITQFTFGALQPTNPATNLMTAGVTTEVASNASNLLMDIKPGYMLGAKPRQQAIGHVIGILAGAIASTPLFYLLFLWTKKPDTAIEQHVTEAWAVPGAVQWAAISKVIGGMGGGGETVQAGADGIAKLWGVLPLSAAWAMLAGAALAIILEVWRMGSKGKFPLSAVGIGLGVVLPPESTIMMWTGALIFSAFENKYHKAIGTFGWRLWVDSKEAVCAGLIAGWALLGIGDGIIAAFVPFPESHDAVVERENKIIQLDGVLKSDPQDLLATVRLGTLLIDEPLSNANLARGLELLASAADRGSLEARTALGNHAEGEGDLAGAAKSYRLAADAGHAAAAAALAELYDGRFDEPGSNEWLAANATPKNPVASRTLANRITSGKAQAGDRSAEALYAEAAAAGDPIASWRHCQNLAKSGGDRATMINAWITASSGGVRESAGMIDAIAAATAESGSPDARRSVADLLTTGRAGRIDIALARKILEGEPALAMQLARNYIEQMPTREGDGARILSSLAKDGSTPAATMLGELLARVDSRPTERAEVVEALSITDLPAEAERLWKDAAAKGDLQAMFDLGWKFDAGWGGTVSKSEARDWWGKAADRGHGRSMYRLGRSFASAATQSTDIEVRKDGLLWLKLAAARKVVGAKIAADRLASEMTPAEVAAVEARVEGWRPTTP